MMKLDKKIKNEKVRRKQNTIFILNLLSMNCVLGQLNCTINKIKLKNF